MMEQLQAGGQPLFGCVTWSARLRPFDYRDAARMVPDRGPREAALVYGIFGGTPRYLAAIQPGEPLATTVTRTFLSPRGEVHVQLQSLIEQERGIRSPAKYRAVLSAVAAGRTRLNEIAQAAGLADQPQTVRRALAVPEGLEIVARERNFRAPPAAPYRHHVADNAVGFWHRFVLPHRSRLVTGDPEDIWEHAVAPALDDMLGQRFEHLTAQAYERYHRRWGMPGARTWARWEGQDRNRRPIELDVVAELDDGRILSGEVKWSSQRRGIEFHAALQRNLDDLARWGHGWARRAQDGPFVYVSAAGFTDEFRRWAQGQHAVRLIELDDLYPGRSDG
jgi:AAA+ ATPase superfamily predicted ATPase